MRGTRIGLVTVVIGVVLTLSALAGGSSYVYPQFAEYYWLGAGGIALLVCGLLVLGYCSSIFQ